MQFSGETLTAVTHQTKLEAITTIMQSLNNPKEPMKKLRHSLKNLCFYKPSPNFLNSLVGIMKRELANPTRCFKLTCFHLISHSFLASTNQQVPSLLDALAKYLTGKEIGKNADLVYRVYFTLSSNIPSYHQNLIETTAAILSIPPMEDMMSQKKSIFGKETISTKEPLVKEVCASLVDLPDFENNAPKLLTDDIVTKLEELIKVLPQQSKNHVMHFLGRMEKTPEKLQNLMTEKAISPNFLTVQYVAKNKDAYSELITSTLQDESKDSYTLKYALCVEGSQEQALIDSLLTKMKVSANCLLPLIELKTKYPATNIDRVLSTLYVATSDVNPTNAFLAFNILLFTDIEKKEWLTTTFRLVFSKFAPDQRAASMKRLYTTWKSLMTSDEVFKRIVSPVLTIVLCEYYDAIEAESFQDFIKFLCEKQIANAFLEMGFTILTMLPPNDTVIYLFYGASLVASTATATAFNAFKSKAELFLQSADPSLKGIYNTLIH